MNENTQPVRYFLYARKSTESEDRQVQSIDDQISRLRELANARGLRVIETLIEAKSAKTPETRPVFGAMVRRVRAGEADGILCWELNRLSRNPVDSGTLSWMLQSAVLRSIMTIEREFRPDDNVLLFSVESGMANQYILDLSRNVKRGLRGRLERGEITWPAPLGYLNDRLNTGAVPDPERFAVMRRAWDLLLSGLYSVPQILRKLNDEWGYRTPQRRRIGGRPVALNSLYLAFRNPFYAGILRSRGREYPGRHRPMVTLEEFEDAQRILTSTHRPRPKRHLFTLSRLVRCGECGCQVVADPKRKWIASSRRVTTYVYYRCTRKRRDLRCSQRHYVREEALVERIAADLDRLAIPAWVRDYAVSVIEALQANETADVAHDEKRLQHVSEEITRQLERLTEMCYSGLIEREEYERDRTKLQNRLTRLRTESMHAVDQRARLSRLRRGLQLLEGIGDRFRDASPQDRRRLIAAVGSNCVLTNGKPLIIARPWVERLKAGASRVVAPSRGLEPNVRGLDNGKADPLGSAITTWLPG